MFGVLFVVLFVYAWFIRWITEIAVTDQRVIYKRGFICRQTAEMNMDKVESVDVDQSILGRLLDYGTIHVERARGAGIEHSRTRSCWIAASRCATPIIAK